MASQAGAHNSLKLAPSAALFPQHNNDTATPGLPVKAAVKIYAGCMVAYDPALSQCQFMIHGHSAVSEAAIWTNLKLHDTSVNLEDEDHLNATQFGNLVQMVMSPRNIPKDQWLKTSGRDLFGQQMSGRQKRAAN